MTTFGGRNWTTFSAFVLLIPTALTIVLLANPGLATATIGYDGTGVATITGIGSQIDIAGQ